jgi:hypothetical protein
MWPPPEKVINIQGNHTEKNALLWQGKATVAKMIKESLKMLILRLWENGRESF